MNWSFTDIVSSIREYRATKGGSSHPSTPEQDIVDFFGGGNQTWAGTSVRSSGSVALV